MVKNPPANGGDVNLILGLGRSPEVGNGNPLQYSCLEKSMERGACWATVHGVAESDMSGRLSLHFSIDCVSRENLSERYYTTKAT